LIISEAGITVKYNVYLLKDAIVLEYNSTNRNRAELAARLLRLAGVDVELKKVGKKDVWRVKAATYMLAAGREELRDALAEIVKTAHKSVDEKKAEGWLEKLEKGRVLKEGWPKYNVELVEGALVVRFASTDRNSIERKAQRLEKMGLKRGVHFTVEMPGEGHDGYVYIRREGLAYAAFLSVYGKDEEQRRLAAEFVKLILQRAEEACGGAEQCAVYEKAKEIIEEGKSWGSLELNFEKWVEVNGKKHVVKVIGGGAEIEKSRRGKKLLRIKITAEVDGVRSEYTITYSRRGGDNAAVGYAYGREADAERYSALIKALTGREPGVYRMKNGKIIIKCYEGHLEGFRRYAELADAIEKWLEETGR
jgi:hypothetical protein